MKWDPPCCGNIERQIPRKPALLCRLSEKNVDPNPSGIGRGRPRYDFVARAVYRVRPLLAASVA